jgi:TRAP-type C4-dicarboxylate transport system permease small subunit
VSEAAALPADPNAAAPKPLRLVLAFIDGLSRLDGWLGAACLVALTALMLANIITRALSNVVPWLPADIPVAWEYSSYLMAATFTFGAAMTLRAGGHIRVSLILANVPPGPRRVLEIAAALLGAAFMGFLAYGMVKFTWASFSRGQTSYASDTPVWLPQAVVAFGMVLLTLQLVARAIQAAFGLPLEDHRMRVAALAE